MTSKKAFYTTATVQNLITDERNPYDLNETQKLFSKSSGLVVTPSRSVQNRTDITGYVLTAYDNYGKVIWSPSQGPVGGSKPAGTQQGAIQLRNYDGTVLEAQDTFYWQNNVFHVPGKITDLTNPTSNQDAATKYYVDSVAGSAKPSGTQVGALQLRNADGTGLDAVDTLYWQNGVLHVPGKITNLTNPTSNQDAATKYYVDSVAGSGVSWKDAVRLTTIGNVNLLSSGAGSGIGTISGLDGSVNLNDRILLKNQFNPVENGIYIASNDMVNWKRSSDLSLGNKASGVAVFVTEGTTFSDKGFVCISDNAVIGDTISFTQFTASTVNPGGTQDGQIQYKSGTTFDASPNLIWLNNTLNATNISTSSVNLTSNGKKVIVTSNPESNYSIVLPTTAGNANEVLKTNGSGVLSWVKQGNEYNVVDLGSGYNGGNPYVPLVSDEVILVNGTTSNDVYIHLPKISVVGKVHYNILDSGNADLHTIFISIKPDVLTDKILFFNDNSGPIRQISLTARYNSVQLINNGVDTWYVY